MKRALLGILALIAASYLILHSLYGNRKKEEIPYAVIGVKPRAMVVDTHSDTLTKVVEDKTWLPSTDIGDRTSFDIDIPKLKEGDVSVQYFAAFTSGYYSKGKPDYLKSNSRLLSLMNAMYWVVHKNPQQIGIVRTFKDIRSLADDDRISAVLAVEGAYSLEKGNGKELLRQYNDLGVRAIGLTWNYSNALGEGANCVYKDGTPSKGGLTEFGKEIVEEMNRLGIIIDVSHMNEETFWHVIKASNKPIIASHSGVYALREHVRNLTDEQIRAIAQKGGTVQIVFYPGFLSVSEDKVGIETIVDHIEHVIKIAGIEHVGIGSDFDGAEMPKDLKDASMLPKLEKELKGRGYGKEEIEKIMGGNIMRVMEEAWEDPVSEEGMTKAPKIKPLIRMGEAIEGVTPVLAAELEAAATGSTIDAQSLKVIVDGRVYIPQFNPEKGAVFLELKEPLTERFHVVTFFAADLEGNSRRETRIFYVQ